MGKKLLVIVLLAMLAAVAVPIYDWWVRNQFGLLDAGLLVLALVVAAMLLIDMTAHLPR